MSAPVVDAVASCGCQHQLWMSAPIVDAVARCRSGLAGMKVMMASSKWYGSPRADEGTPLTGWMPPHLILKSNYQVL